MCKGAFRHCAGGHVIKSTSRTKRMVEHHCTGLRQKRYISQQACVKCYNVSVTSPGLTLWSPDGYSLKCSGPYWFNPPFLIFLTFGHSGAQDWKIRKGGLDQCGSECFGIDSFLPLSEKVWDWKGYIIIIGFGTTSLSSVAYGMWECSWLLKQRLSIMICVSMKSCEMQQDGSALICMLFYCCCCCSWS